MPETGEVKGEAYLEIIHSLIKDMKYGTITVIVQDGKVIQIDKTDKIRCCGRWNGIGLQNRRCWVESNQYH